MKSRPRILDLFCGAGGCAQGYYAAGFDVVGVDSLPQPRYPFPFIQADALSVLSRFWAGACGGTVIDEDGRHWGLEDFAAIHASPPCKRFSKAANRNKRSSKHLDLLTPTREFLEDLALPWVIENVPGAPMRPPAVQLCGVMFGLRVFRHRWFESSELLLAPPHQPHGSRRIGLNGYCSISGRGGYTPGNFRTTTLGRAYQNKAAWAAAVRIDWMTRDELSQAVPPAYTRFVGLQLMNALQPQRSDHALSRV